MSTTARPAAVPLIDEVARDLFVPARIWVRDPERGGYVVLDQTVDEARWRDAVRADAPVLTQLNDGHDDRGGRIEPGMAVASSSSSKPSIMAGMLSALDVAPGDRVLEIGTGTGWNAALLAHRAGPDGDVTTVEVDPDLAGAARAALERGGHRVRIVCGDGLAGVAAHAPYDRIISTAAIVETVPAAWIEQLRPGGVLVTPWTTAWGGGAQLTLHRPDTTSGGGAGSVLARGRFSGNLAFMPIRSQRIPLWARELSDDDLDGAATRIIDCRGNDFDRMFDPTIGKFGVGAQLGGIIPDIRWGPGELSNALVDLDDPLTGSFARITGDFADPAPFTVRQLGPRRLWDEAEAAYDWWWEHGRPAVERFGLTVTCAAQELWLDERATRARTWTCTHTDQPHTFSD